MRMFVVHVLLLLLVLCIPQVNDARETTADYGVDCSFPIHSTEFKCGDTLGDRESFYLEYMEGCRQYYKNEKASCDRNEKSRLDMSVRQPQSMVNYTLTGYKKIRAPASVMKLITDHWEKNQHRKKKEEWRTGNIYVNHWSSPSYLVNIEDPKLRGTGSSRFRLKNLIWDAAQSTIEEWVGMELRPTSMYGIRVYTEGAVLSPHVDRLPLVSSCIVNVAQDVDEPWPLEVYDRQGNAVNITMEPGDMVLYESGSLIHGRPFPLKGRYYANIFIHFEPIGPLLHEDSEKVSDDPPPTDDLLPIYLLKDSPEVEEWTLQNPYGWKTVRRDHIRSSAQVDTLTAHAIAINYDLMSWTLDNARYNPYS